MIRRRYATDSAIGILLLLLLGSCASVPGRMATRSVEEIRSFKPPAGQAGLYVIRPSGFVGVAALWNVDIDTDALGKLGNNSFLHTVVAPGEHNIRAIYQDSGLTFKAEPDRNYFFLVKPSLTTGRVEQVSEAEGRELVMKLIGK